MPAHGIHEDKQMTIRISHAARRRCAGRGSPLRPAGGFSLVELVVAMVVMVILSSVALASYRSFTLESRRTTATTALTDAASRQEQFFLNNKTYTATLGSGGINVPATVTGGYYTLSIDAPTVACPIARCWVMRAAPQGNQGDDSCGTLSFTSEGDKSPAGCW
jgi:type IV pilus assembly protein PilE